MQQRYYDPLRGCFLNSDVITAPKRAVRSLLIRKCNNIDVLVRREFTLAIGSGDGDYYLRISALVVTKRSRSAALSAARSIPRN
jgi:hypothetical protein